MSSIYDGLEYIYAENLKGKDWPLTIEKVVGGVEFHNTRTNKKDKGYDIYFKGAKKKFGFTSTTVRRQLFVATGTEETDEMGGKEITLYPVKSAKAATGQEIRIRI